MHSKKHSVLYILICELGEYPGDYIQSLAAKYQAVVYIDDCSEGIRERPNWDRLEMGIVDGLISKVIVPSIDGLALNPSEMIKAIDFITSSDVQIISEKEAIDTSGTGQHAVLRAVVNGFKSIHSRRTREGIKDAKSTGTIIGRPTVITNEIRSFIQRKHASGRSLRAIKADLHQRMHMRISVGTIQGVTKEPPVSAR